MRLLVISLCLLISSCAPNGGGQNESRQAGATPQLHTEEIRYFANGDTLVGYIAYDSQKTGKRPGVLVVHEWWGHNAYARKRAEMLAELGYTALAVDMYGNGKQADHPEDAQKFSAEVFQNFDRAKTRFLAGLDRLKQEATVDTSKIAAIGYCFGGGVVLNLARQGVDLKGVASFHGGLEAIQPAQPGGVRAALLVCEGADDPFTTADQVETFKNEMDRAGVDYEFKSYPGAMHSFTNPAADENGQKFGLPLAYNQAADEQSWAELQTFFAMIFAD